MTTDQLLEKLYQNPSELEKMAQERFAVQSALETLHKVANEASLDLSGMSQDEQVQLYNYVVGERQAQEQAGTAEGQAAQVPGQTQAPVGQVPTQLQVAQSSVAPAQTAQPVAQAEPQLTEEFQQKVAENMYFSELFGKNAARHYWNEVQALQKQAEDMGMGMMPMKGKGDEDKKEEDKGSPTFEAMAKEKAMKMKEETEKSAAFDLALEKRARELLASGKV